MPLCLTMASDESASESGSAAIPNLIVIGASLGGLKAVSHLLGALPPDLPAAIILIQHLSPHSVSRLASILNAQTQLTVEDASPGHRIELGHVYVAPCDQHLTIDRFARLRLNTNPRVNYTRPAIDPLFDSAAANFDKRVVAVLLTGFGRDGSRGVSAVQKAGGVVIVQDEATSQHFGMPSAAIATGHVDYVLALDDISGRILQLLTQSKV